MTNKENIIIIAKTGFLYCLMVWVYVIAMQIAHPESVAWTFASWINIRMDIVGETAFVVSLFCFLIWQYYKNQ